MAVSAVLAVGACGGDGGSGGHATHEGDSDSAGGAASGGAGERAHEEDTAPAFPEAEATTRSDVTLRDYVFLGLPTTVKGPNVLFEATVSGSNQHELEIVDSSRQLVGAIHSFEAGTTKTLAVVLQPGTYTVQCLVKEGARTHAELGMKAPLTVE